MSLDFRLSLKFNHLINIITIAREEGKNMKNKTLLKWIIIHYYYRNKAEKTFRYHKTMEKLKNIFKCIADIKESVAV